MDGRLGVDASSFGAILRRHRGDRGLTQEELAERAGIHVQQISQIERGMVRRPRSTTVQFLADALKLTAQERAAFCAAAHEPTVQTATARASVPHVHTERGPRWMVTAALLCTMLAGVVAGVFVDRVASPGGEAGTQVGSAVGYPHTPEGAAEAAGNYLAAIDADWLSRERSPDLQRTPPLTTGTPLAYRVTSYTNLTATVAVWLVTTVGVTDDSGQQMQANFAEGKATVVWLRQDWRLHRVSSDSLSGGTTPSSVPTPGTAIPNPVPYGFTPYG